MFNALSYTAKLEENGFERKQAEILIRTFMQMMEFNMVSRGEFESFQNEFDRFRTEVYHRFEKVDARFDSLEERIDHKLNKLSLQLTIKLGIMQVISVGLISTLLAMK